MLRGIDLVDEAEQMDIHVRQGREEFAQAVDFVLEKGLSDFLEIGSFHGGSAYVFSKALRERSTVVLVDTCDRKGAREKLETVAQLIRDRDGHKVTLIVGSSLDPAVVEQVQAFGITFGLIHIDGSHYTDDVCLDYTHFSPLLRTGGVILFHDVVVSKMVNAAWKFIEKTARKGGCKTKVIGGDHWNPSKKDRNFWATGIGVIEG